MKILHLTVSVLSLVAWLSLFLTDWKLGIILFFILWQENINKKTLIWVNIQKRTPEKSLARSVMQIQGVHIKRVVFIGGEVDRRKVIKLSIL